MAARQWRWLALVAAAVLILGAHRSGAEQADGRKDGDTNPWMVKVSTPVSGIIAYVATPLKKGEKAPPGRALSIAGMEFRRLAVGDKVAAGQILLQLDDRLTERDLDVKYARLKAAEAEVVAARGIADEAKIRAETAKSLVAAKAIAREEAQLAVVTREKYEAELLAKEQAVKIAKADWQRTKAHLDVHQLRSPVDGVIRAIYKIRGEGVHALDSILLIEESVPKE